MTQSLHHASYKVDTHRSADLSSSVSLSSSGASLSSISEQDDSPSSSTGVSITKKAKNYLQQQISLVYFLT